MTQNETGRLFIEGPASFPATRPVRFATNATETTKPVIRPLSPVVVLS